MKKVTLRSVATWTVGISLLVGYQIAGQRWPVLTGRSIRSIATLLAVGVAAASTGLMEDVESQEVLYSRNNTSARNVLNILYIAFLTGGGFGIFYLAGFFGSVELRSPAFYAAAIALLISIAFQIGFVVATRRPEARS